MISTNSELLLEEILHQRLVVVSPFIHPRRCKISSINSYHVLFISPQLEKDIQTTTVQQPCSAPHRTLSESPCKFTTVETAQVFILGMLLAKLRQLLDQKAKISQHGCPKKTRVASGMRVWLINKNIVKMI